MVGVLKVIADIGEITPWKLAKPQSQSDIEKIQYEFPSYNIGPIYRYPICCQDMASQPWFGLQSIGNKIQKRFTSNISRYLWRNLFHFSKLRWLVGFPFYSIYSIFKLISKKKLNLHIYLLIEFQPGLESKFEIIPFWSLVTETCNGFIKFYAA